LAWNERPFGVPQGDNRQVRQENQAPDNQAPGNRAHLNMAGASAGFVAGAAAL
jgi:hypothetical protein